MYLILRRDDEAAEGPGSWQRSEIPDEGLALRRGASGGVDLLPGGEEPADAWVVPCDESGARHAALVVARGVRDLFVGGHRPLPLSLLEERSEIVLGGERIYFSARRPLALTRYAGDASCGVCGDRVDGCEAVVCTHCAAVTHDGALVREGERRCLSERGACPGCQLRREDFDWSPEDADA